MKTIHMYIKPIILRAGVKFEIIYLMPQKYVKQIDKIIYYLQYFWQLLLCLFPFNTKFWYFEISVSHLELQPSSIPCGTWHFHQTIAHKKHQKQQSPSVGCSDSNDFQIGSGKTKTKPHFFLKWNVY